MSKRDDAIILDLMRASQLAVEFLGGLSQEDFDQDLKTQASVLHQLMVLGEGVKRLSLEYRSENPQVPWRAIAGMRDTLIHEYDDVDLGEVWRTIRRDVPALIQMLERLAPKQDG